MSPLFSIGVPTYDRDEMLYETLNSIASQTFGDYEVIVSNDNPDRKISGQSIGICDPRFKFINQTKNLGELSNMSYLLQESTGRYFTWSMDDDLYLPEFLESIYKTLVKNSFPKCVFTSFSFFRGKTPAIKVHGFVDDGELIEGNEFLYRYSKGELKTISVTGMFERQTMKEIGGMEDVSGDGKGMFGEYMLFVRIAMLDKAAYIKRPLILHRIHDQTLGNSYKKEIKMHRAGAENLTRQCILIFESPRFRKHFYTYTYAMLKSVLLNNLVAMSRCGEGSIKKIMDYLIYAKIYIDSLKRTKMYLVGMAALLHAEISVIFLLLMCKIRKKLWKEEPF